MAKRPTQVNLDKATTRQVAKPRRPEERKRKVRFGGLKGKLEVPDDFDAPLPESIISAFEDE